MLEGTLQKYEGVGLVVIWETTRQVGTPTEVDTKKGLEIGIPRRVSGQVNRDDLS